MAAMTRARLAENLGIANALCALAPIPAFCVRDVRPLPDSASVLLTAGMALWALTLVASLGIVIFEVSRDFRVALGWGPRTGRWIVLGAVIFCVEALAYRVLHMA